MKLLLVSFFFPPRNTIGAVRTGKLAKFLHHRGHDIRVLTACHGGRDDSLPVEIPHEKVCRTRWFNLDALPAAVWSALRPRRPDTVAPPARAKSRASSVDGPTRPLHRRLYSSVVNLPDAQIGWLPFATAAGRALLKTWRPDLIYASYTPFTSHLVASRLARTHDLPWVAEYRDLWVDHGNYDLPSWRRRLDAALEQRVVRTASRVVAVNEPSAEVLRRKFAPPVEVVMNGFDPDDYRAAGQIGDTDPKRLTLVYTGQVYRSHRIDALLEALRLMGESGQRVRVRFFGPFPERLFAAADLLGLAERLDWGGQLSFHDALAHQMRADVLLLLLWMGAGRQTHFHAKMFEYLGARRPILGIGDPSDPAAEVIHKRAAGVVSTDPEAIRDQLERWLAVKRNGAGIPPTPEEASRGLSRDDQFSMLEASLEELARPDRQARVRG